MRLKRLPRLGTSNPSRPGSLLRTVVLSDLVDSTALIERLGDQVAAELIRRHDRMAREVMQRHGGREVDKTDGFLVLFERPFEAVAFALEYQRKLKAFAEEAGQPLSARIGIHLGEIVVWENSPADVTKGAKPVEVEGLAKPIAARLMGLALPGQILVSAVAQSLAQRAHVASGKRSESVRWLAHGNYQFKGVTEALPIYEVGEPGVAPLRPPPASAKAWPAKPLWRRPRSIAFASTALVLATAVAIHLGMRSESALGFGERDWVVIGDLVNLNADQSFDITLASAFRIGIEESRYVNVVSDSAVRQALMRMQRDPKTRVDRDVGSEIALREQARALLVPSIAQYGPKLRLAVELVDPNGARTVGTQTADADGPADILPAMDRLLRGVRTRLGESLPQIQSTSQPLEKVTTPNLEALRALARGVQLQREGDVEQSIRLLKYATELDPDFATAYARMGSLLFAAEMYPEARAALEKSLTFEGRLSERERIYVRALLACFVDPRAMLDAWRMYVELYPSLATGHNNLGNVNYYFLHDYRAAEVAYEQALALPHPLKNFTAQALAHVLLAQEKVVEAEQRFRSARALAPPEAFFGLADALVAGGKLEEAAQYLDEARKQPTFFEVERGMRRATLLVARDDIDNAVVAIQAALREAEMLTTPNARWRAQNAMVALLAARGELDRARDLSGRVLAETLVVAARPDSNLEVTEEMLYAASWAARLGLTDQARKGLTVAKQSDSLDRFPIRGRLATLVEAELELKAGRAEVAIERLQSTAPETGLWEARELRARAFRALGDKTSEQAELKWLVAHRGLAYAQWTDGLLGQQARALALRDAETQLVNYGPPKVMDTGAPGR